MAIYIPSSVLVSDCGKCMTLKISMAFIKGGLVDLGVLISCRRHTAPSHLTDAELNKVSASKFIGL